MTNDFFVPNNEKNSKSFFLIAIAFFLFLAFVIFSFYWEVALGSVLVFILLFIFAFFPEFGLYSMIIFLPFIDWNFQFFNRFEIPFIDLLAVLVIISFFIRNFYFFLFSREKVNLKFPIFLPFLLFFAIITISNIFSENILGNIWYSARWILLFYFAYILFPFNIVKSKRVFKNSLICFVISGMLIAIMGFISLFLQDWQNEFVRVSPISIFNIFPIGKNHNLIAEVLAITIFFTLALKRCFTEEKIRRLLDLSAIFQALILIGTFSRAGWIALFLGVFIYLFYIKGKSLKKIILPIILGIIIISPLVFYMFKLQSVYNIGGTSNASRMLALEIATNRFLENPLLGYGSGTFVSLLEENTRFVANYGQPLDSHGVWQKVLVENGIFGFLAFSYFVLYISFKAIKKLKKYNKYYQTLLPIMIGVFAMFVIQFFNTSYYKGKLWLPVALMLAAFNIIEINLKKNDQKKN